MIYDERLEFEQVDGRYIDGLVDARSWKHNDR